MYKYQINDIYPVYVPTIQIELLPLNINRKFADILSINLDFNNKLKYCKNKIDKLDNKIWEDVKKITNPYEYIYRYTNTYKRKHKC